jgi:hypothetical protein
MYAHPAEVMAKSWLHEGASGWFQRPAGCPQNFMDNRWRGGRPLGLDTNLVLAQSFLPALGTLPAGNRMLAAGTFPLEQATAYFCCSFARF